MWTVLASSSASLRKGISTAATADNWKFQQFEANALAEGRWVRRDSGSTLRPLELPAMSGQQVTSADHRIAALKAAKAAESDNGGLDA